MPFDRPAQAPELSQQRRPIRRDPLHARARVHVGVVHVPDSAVRPAARRVNQASGIELAHEAVDAGHVILPPAFVERDPHHDRRKERERVNQLLQLRLELLGGILGSLGVLLVLRADQEAVRVAAPQVAIRHVLPHHQAHAVAVVIPAGRLHLDMLSGRVETQALGHFDVICQGLVGRRGVQPVRPPALVQRTKHELRLAIEEQAREAARVLAEGDVPDGEIAACPIQILFVAREDHVEVVQVRLIGSP